MPRSAAAGTDCFTNFAPTPVRCRWLSSADERRAGSATVIRLVVDDARGCSDEHAVSEVYNRAIIRDVRQFVGPTSALFVTPAGLVTTPFTSSPSLAEATVAIRDCIGRLDVGDGPFQMLLGVDACIRGSGTPVQSVAVVPAATPHVVLKLHPAGAEERRTLVGYAACVRAGGPPAELLAGHVVETAVGRVLVLVCHEAALFSGRSASNLSDGIGIAVREGLRATAGRPDWVLIATHWQDRRSGNTFLDAANKLADEFGTTVVATMRTPRQQLEKVAERFAIRGPNAAAAATLLVEDTLDE